MSGVGLNEDSTIMLTGTTDQISSRPITSARSAMLSQDSLKLFTHSIRSFSPRMRSRILSKSAPVQQVQVGCRNQARHHHHHPSGRRSLAERGIGKTLFV